MQQDPPPPRVVHITPVSVTLGFVAGQAGFLRSRGMALEAVSTPDDGLAEFGRREGVAVHAAMMSRTITPLRDLVTLYRLWRLLRLLRPAIVDAHTPKGGLLGMTAAWLAGVPVRVYHVHGLPILTSRGARRIMLQWSDQVAGRLAHRVLCVSDSIRHAALDKRLFPFEKVKVLASGTINGLDSEVRFNPAVVGRDAGSRVRAGLEIPAKAQVLGFIGRVVRFKGVVELAEAWRDLRERYPDLYLLVVGPFETKDAIPAEVRDGLDGDPRVRLVVGWVDDVPPYYAALDVLALPSHREGFPYALLEAAAMELPVVATRVPGCIDAVEDGVTGVLFPPYDARALAEAGAAYLDDPSLRREHGRAGRARIIREFGQQEVWDALFREYGELLATRRGAAPDADAGPTDRKIPGGTAPEHPSVASDVKRLTDRTVAAMGLVLSAPVFAAVASAIYLTMGPPVLFRQFRPGYRARPVAIYKFRTMQDDPRVDGRLLPEARQLTRLGRLLRKTSLDELPQLWNVLWGDMSLVGPRPLLMQYLPIYSRDQARRHEVRPGITGWAQVNGRDAITWDQTFRYDVWYVDHWSYWLDMKILLLTIGRVIQRALTPEEITGMRTPFPGPAEEHL